ncbi:L-threonylcarbamoyladenylate synthase [Oceanobacillus sp. CAU 1775]
MRTKQWTIKTNEAKHNEIIIKEAAALLLKGETVAFPTETVYGLGADATNEAAVSKIFEAKGRPQDNPLIAHVATYEQLQNLVDNIPNYVESLIEAFSPGPLTYVLPSNGRCANNVTAGLSTIAVRIPDHEVALQIIEEANIPIAAPSANLSGKPSPTTAAHVHEDLDGKISGIVDGGPTGVGLESTVIACREKDVVILRPGGITQEQLERFVNVTTTTEETPEQPTAPGMKYKHYSPEMPLWLVDGDAQSIQKLIQEEQANGKRVGLLASEAIYQQVAADRRVNLGTNISEVAINLYDGLRSFKASEIDLIIAEAFTEKEIGAAVMNRLRKAMTSYIELDPEDR